MKDGTVIERDARLSRSRLWDLERRWYELAGERAWSVLPYYITTNPTMGAAIAQVIAGWARDGGAGGLPITILELGAGTGRLAWHVTRSLDRLAHVVPSYRYVMSDLPERTRAWWRDHPQLAGSRIEHARIDCEDPDETFEAIGRGPLVVIATYLFDSLRSDVYAVRDGIVLEKRVSLIAPDDCDLDGEDALGQIGRAWSTAPIESYGDRDLDAVLASYASLPDAELTFPIAALRLLRRLEERSGGRMLVLAADKGFVEPSSMIGRSEPDLMHHGCLSIAVNLHALGADAARRGAAILTTEPSRIRLATIAIAHGAPKTDELRAAFDEAFAHAGPDDWYALKRTVERRYSDCELDELLAILRTSRGDENVFRGCASVLFERTCAAPPSQLPGVRAAVRDVLSAYYWIGEEGDLPFLAGCALALADDLPAARSAWQQALAIDARAPGPCQRLAMSGVWLGDDDDPRVIACEAEPLYREVRARLLR
nr:hypothetical protein [Kofleriaceae bacterium]